MGRLAYRILSWLRGYLERYAPNPELLMYQGLSSAWESSAKECLLTLKTSTDTFQNELLKTKMHYRILERSYGSYIANNAGIRIKLKMDEEWPERYAVQALVPPQLGLFLMDKSWDLKDQDIHIKNFSAMLAATVEHETYVFLKEKIKQRQPQKQEMSQKS